MNSHAGLPTATPPLDTLHIIALMSGTSVDSIDGVLVEIRGQLPNIAVQVRDFAEQYWPPELRRRLLLAMAPASVATAEICELNILAAREFAALANKLVDRSGLAPAQIQAIASHGQTICHLPPGPDRPTGSTLQIGDISTIAQLTGRPTIGNFRTADMAMGGQGAPLVPLADQILLSHKQLYRCVQNIGGIANVTGLPPTGEHGSRVCAFDTGPGNMLIDALVELLSNNEKRHDEQGRWAARGKVELPLLEELKLHPFFTIAPPKSTGREDFGRQLAERLVAGNPGMPPENLLATVTELTAWSIANAYRCLLPRFPEEVIVCGGGIYNDYLMACLNRHLFPQGESAVKFIDAFGIPNKAREAVCFAILGCAWLQGFPGNLPTVTGAAKGVICGQYAQP